MRNKTHLKKSSITLTRITHMHTNPYKNKIQSLTLLKETKVKKGNSLTSQTVLLHNYKMLGLKTETRNQNEIFEFFFLLKNAIEIQCIQFQI